MEMKFITYRQLGKHRKKCHWCDVLIDDGEKVYMKCVQKEKWYPVKGIMKFNYWWFWHEGCKPTE